MTGRDAATLQRLSFRRQFILGRRFVDAFPSWQRVALDGSWCVTAHPDLTVRRVGADGKWIALLGYILDPSRPVAGDADVLAELLGGFGSCEDLVEHTGRLGGRWVLAAHDGDRTVLFADAAGLRQVVYTAGPTAGPAWCASQPGLLAAAVDLEVDAEASAFVQAGDPRHKNPMVWFPGDATLYAGCRQLLPNHCLDLRTGQSRRFWPTADLPRLPLRTAIGTSARLLRGMMESAGRRFPMMLALTAGWDSRVTLAAAGPLAGRARCYTAVFRNTPDDSDDVTTPAKLLGTLGLKHEILDCRIAVDDEFARIYRGNVTGAHEQYGPVAQALLDGAPADAVCVTGDVGEIAKCVYRRAGGAADGEITALELATLTRVPPHPFVLDAFERWIAGVRARPCNVPLLDLYYWEQEAGRLQAMIEAECDIARESLAPMNCRILLTAMLSVPERYRQEPSFDLLRAVMVRLWPDVLTEPINGQPQVGIEAVLRRVLARLRLLRAVPRPVKRLVKHVIRRSRPEAPAAT